MKRSAVFSRINHLFQGRIQKFLIEGGVGGVGDGPNFGSERTPSPLPTAAVARYFKIFWPLTVCRCTRKGYTLGTASSVNAGRCWRGKYCFASSGEQIGGEYPKTITFFNIPGILFSGKCNARFIKKINQLKSDIRSCRCKNFSLKQASGLIWGGFQIPHNEH